MICEECGHYPQNIPGCFSSGFCQADLLDDRCEEWFVRREPNHVCHRPDDFKELPDGGVTQR